MHYYPSTGTGYRHCRNSEGGVGSSRHRRRLSSRRDLDDQMLDSGDSALSDLESESGSGSASGSGSGSASVDVDPNLPYPGIAPISMRYLSQTTRPRNWCLALISNPWFERISMMVILLNCVTLGMYQPCIDDKCESNRCKILQVFDDFIFAFFTLEMTIKMVAMGVYGRGSYLADSWNRLDLFIVLAGALEYCLNVENMNLSAIRTIRVLRPLRAINRIPSMRILVMLLLDTLPMLGNVLLLCFFVFFIFGIVGVQLWQGMLRQRCYLQQHQPFEYPQSLSGYYTLNQEQEYICSQNDHSGMHMCGHFPPYREGDLICNGSAIPGQSNDPTNTSCVNWNQYYTDCQRKGDNPFQGTISFDNIGLAWVAIFLVISLEGWTDIMYYVQDAHSFWDWIYFVLLIVIGSFFMINLCLVVIATQFSETKKREMERMRLERARFQSTSTLASSTNNSEPTTCYAEIVKYVAHLWRRAKRRTLKKIRLLRYRRDQRRDKKIAVNETLRLNFARRHHPCCPRYRHSNLSAPASRCSTASAENSSHVNPDRDRSDATEPVEPASGASPPSGKRGGLLRVPSISTADVSCTENTTVQLLSPPSNNNRRRCSVMFSDDVLLHGICGSGNNSGGSGTDSQTSNTSAVAVQTTAAGNNNQQKNVCSSEKMTQTGDGNIWQISNSPNQQQITQQQIANECCELNNGEAMTCQELLALSGALSAALPTGQIALDSFFSSLTKGITNRQNNAGEDIYNQQWTEEDFSCCQDMWHCEAEYKNAKRSRLYIGCCLIIKGFIRSLSLGRKYIKKLVDHKYFQQGILLAILINTLSMGIEYHDQPEYLTMVVETSNIVFSAIFAVEMLLKVIAEGPFGYISNGFNVFDGVIVCLSAVELFQTFMGDRTGGNSGLSVLRTFRLLRILKLVRFMPNLRRQLFVMLRTMDNVAVFFSLLILFIFIFSILGMNLFGCKFCTDDEKPTGPMENYDDSECDRKNFDTLLWALVTVFQILTQEDWNMVLSNGMAKTSHWAALYFVALMTFGNYVLFNLLVAILVEGFSAERNERREREQREAARHRKHSSLDTSDRCSDDTSRSISDSTDSYGQDSKNVWRSAEELRKSIKELNSYAGGACAQCEIRAAERAAVAAVSVTGGSSRCRGSLLHHYDNLRPSECEPKCNIQKQTMRQPPQKQNSPPLITHTAATPQDSPSTTLEEFPEFRYSISSSPSDIALSISDDGRIQRRESCDISMHISNTFDYLNPYLPRGSIYYTNLSLSASMPGLLKPPSLSPPPKTFRQIEKTYDEILHHPASPKLITHNERVGSKTTTFSEKVSLGNNGNGQSKEKLQYQEKSNGNNPEGKCKIQRGYSWKLSRPSLRKKNVKNRSGSDSDAILVLNNGRDHSQCNGGGVTRHASLRNDSLLQQRIQNDTQKDAPNNRSVKGLSPQNSIRSRASTFSSSGQMAWGPSLTRQNSLTSHNSGHTINRYNNSPTMVQGCEHASRRKPNNLSQEKPGIAVPDSPLPKITEAAGDSSQGQTNSSCNDDQSKTILRQIFSALEPKGYLKGRDEYSLYIFTPKNRFRKFCKWLVEQKYFDNVILLFIALNCITLAMERPNIPPTSTERYFLATANYVFTVVFAAEMFVKVVAAGICYGPDAYFTSGWNIMDGSLVIISIIDLLMSIISESSPKIFNILRVFRLLRSLRPLRVINRAPGLKLVVQTLLSSLRPIGNIVLICCTFFIIFGILGVQLFKGAFYYCKGEFARNVTNKQECLAHKENHWVNQKYNFDDLGKALMSLFVLSSRDGWVNIMYTGLDAVGVDQQPVVNYSEWRLLYFISFILLVGFFVLNMFVGVVVENFHRCREEQEKEERVRRAAKRALQLEKRRRKMNEPPYYDNYSRSRLFIHNVVTSKYFDLAIAAVIGLNVVTMATECYLMPDSLEYALKIFNYFFTAVFILESLMKLIALGILLYLKDKWNQLDVGIVILSVVGIVLEELKSNIIPINPTVLRVMRVLRIARVLKLLKMAKGIRALLDTVMQALPQVGNLGLLFFLLFFIFAALGVELFGKLECSDEFPCQGLGEHAHFSNFGMAFLTLFRVATGDNWNGIMKDTLREDCDDSTDCVKNCCVSTVIAPIFFVIFVLMAQFVLVNVVVAVLMKHLEESHKHLEDEQDMDTQLEREFQQKQDLQERKELYLALQLDSECVQPYHKPLTKVLSLPSNFTYNPPGSERQAQRHPSTGSQGRRKTLHCPQQIFLSHLDDIKNIDESTSDICNIREASSFKNLDDKNKTLLHIQTNFDDIITIDQHADLIKIKETENANLLKVADKEHPPKSIKENVLNIPIETKPQKMNLSISCEPKPMKSIKENILAIPSDTKPQKTNILTIPMEQKPLHKLYGSTKHLFRQKSMDVTEQTPFLLTPQQSTEESEKSEPVVCIELKLHDSQESVQRIISERRKLDDRLRDINEFDIFERRTDDRKDIAQNSSCSRRPEAGDSDIAEDLC